MSLRDKILAAEDLERQVEEIPEWGVTVEIRGLSGTDRDAYEAKAIALKRGGTDVELRLQNYRSKLLVKCLFDPESGERIFTERDVPELGKRSGVVIDRLFDIARELSGMGDEALEAARGNSGAAPSGASTTDSP